MQEPGACGVRCCLPDCQPTMLGWHRAEEGQREGGTAAGGSGAPSLAAMFEPPRELLYAVRGMLARPPARPAAAASPRLVPARSCTALLPPTPLKLLASARSTRFV